VEKLTGSIEYIALDKENIKVVFEFINKKCQKGVGVGE